MTKHALGIFCLVLCCFTEPHRVYASPAEPVSPISSLLREDFLTAKHLLLQEIKNIETPILDLVCLQAEKTTTTTCIGAIQEILKALPQTQLSEKERQLIEERFKEHYATLSQYRRVNDRTSKTFRNIDVVRNASTRFLSVARNAVIAGDLTVGGNQTIDGNLTVTGKINGSSSSGSGNFVINGGQTGSVTVGTTDASNLTLITNGTDVLTIDQTGAVALPNLPSGIAGSNVLYIDTSTGAVTSGPASGGGDIINGGQTGPITIGTNNATSLTLEANNKHSLVIDFLGQVNIPGTSTGNSLAITGSSSGNALVVNASSSLQPAIIINGPSNNANIMEIIGASGGTGAGLDIDVSSATSGNGLVVNGNSVSAAVVINANGGPTPLALNGLPTGAVSTDFLLLVDGSGNVAQTSSTPASIFVVNGGQNGTVTVGTNDANLLSFKTNGNTRMSIDDNGAVTINAPLTGTALSVTGDDSSSDAVAFLQQGSGSTGSALVAQAGSSATGAIIQVLDVATSSGTGIVIDMENGSGIGLQVTGNSSNPATVITAGSGQTPLQLQSLQDGDVTTDFGLLVDSSGNTLKTTSTLATTFVINGGQNGTVTVGSKDANPLNFKTNNLTRQTIDATGQVTINAPTSGTALSVTGFAGASPAVSITQGASSGNALQVTAVDGANAPAVTITGAANANNIMDITGVTGGTSGGLSIDVSSQTGGTGLTVTGNTNNPAVVCNAASGQSPLALNGIQDGDVTTDYVLLWDSFTNVKKTNALAADIFVINGGQEPISTLTIGTTNANSLSFITNNAEKMSISSNGNVTINTPSAGDTLTLNQVVSGKALVVNASGNSIGAQFAGTNTATGDIVKITTGTGSSADALHIDVSAGTGTALKLDGLGSGTGTPLLLDTNNNVILQSSSRRYKENFRTLEDASGIYKLKPTIFDLKKENGGEKNQIGFIAEEVKEIFPTMVNHDKDGNVQSIRYDCFHALLVKELQEHRKALDVCEKQLEAHSSLINTLLNKITELQK